MNTNPPFRPEERARIEALGIEEGPGLSVHWNCPRCGGRFLYRFPRRLADILVLGKAHPGYEAAAEYLNEMAAAAERRHAEERCAIRN